MPIAHSRYSREDIEIVLAGITRDKLPETYRAALEALESAGPAAPPEAAAPSRYRNFWQRLGALRVRKADRPGRGA